MITKVCQSVINKFSTQTLGSPLKTFSGFNIPEPLKFDRQFKYTKLSNGITVASQFMPGKIATVCAFIKCGSRNQTKQSSGTAHFLEHLHFKGTSQRSRDDLGLEVQAIGGNLNAFTSRQLTCYSISVFHKNLKNAVDIVGDMITNSKYQNQDVEAERSTIHRELIETQKATPLQSTIQLAHRGVYKNHQMGLPILGSIQNMKTISRDMIVQYHDNNYVGQNLIVAGCGNLNHDQLVAYVQKYIKVKKIQSNKNTPNFIKPTFNEGMLFLQSSYTKNVNVAVLYEAPSYFDSDFFAFLLLQKILGDKSENELQQQIMSALPTYRLQNMMVKYPWIQKQKGVFVSYVDTGLFGNYFVIPPEKLPDLLNIARQGYELYANKITDQQLQKAKRKVFMQLMQHMNHEDIIQDMGNNLIYYDRRVCRSQISHRLNNFTKEDIQRVIKTLMKHKLNVTVWGNTRALQKKYASSIQG